MKRLIGWLMLLPLSISAMDAEFHFQGSNGPVTHVITAKQFRKYPFDAINALTADELFVKKEHLLTDSAFRAELPIIIRETAAFQAGLKDDVCAKKCYAYCKCCAKASLSACVAGYVANLTHNIDLGAWLCLTGTSISCYQCNNELKRNGRVRADMQRKIELLQQAQREVALVSNMQPIVAPHIDMETYSFNGE